MVLIAAYARASINEKSLYLASVISLRFLLVV